MGVLLFLLSINFYLVLLQKNLLSIIKIWTSGLSEKMDIFKTRNMTEEVKTEEKQKAKWQLASS